VIERGVVDQAVNLAEHRNAGLDQTARLFPIADVGDAGDRGAAF
jgi:hypothetical protein